MLTTDKLNEIDDSQTDPAKILITDWFRRVRESQFVHYSCGNYFSKLHMWLGIPTIVLSTLVGTAIFASLDNQNIVEYKILVGLVSILAAVLSGLQTFLSFSERGEKHRETAAGYASVRRRLEMLKTFTPSSKEELMKVMQEIEKELDDLAQAAPDVPPHIYDRVMRDLKSREHKRVFHLPLQQG